MTSPFSLLFNKRLLFPIIVMGVFLMALFKLASVQVFATSLSFQASKSTLKLPSQPFVNKELGINLASVQTVSKKHLISDQALPRFLYEDKHGNRHLIFGFVVINGRLYDFDNKLGEIKKNVLVIKQGQVYDFGSNGQAIISFPYQVVHATYQNYEKRYLLSNHQVPKAGLYLIKSQLAYLNQAGYLLYQGQTSIGHFLYFKQHGEKALLLHKTTGKWTYSKKGKQTKRSFIKQDGDKAKGLTAIGNRIYFFSKSGVLESKHKIAYHGQTLTFNQQGKLIALNK